MCCNKLVKLALSYSTHHLILEIHHKKDQTRKIRSLKEHIGIPPIILCKQAKQQMLRTTETVRISNFLRKNHEYDCKEYRSIYNNKQDKNSL